MNRLGIDIHVAICCQNFDELERLKKYVCQAWDGMSGGVQVLLMKSLRGLLYYAKQNNVYIPCVIVSHPEEYVRYGQYMDLLLRTFVPVQCICIVNGTRQYPPGNFSFQDGKDIAYSLAVIDKDDLDVLDKKLLELRDMIPQMLDSYHKAKEAMIIARQEYDIEN